MTAVHINDLFSEAEQAVLSEALRQLRLVKIEAMETLNEHGIRPGGRAYEARDFGIPLIDGLLRKLDEGAEWGRDEERCVRTEGAA